MVNFENKLKIIRDIIDRNLRDTSSLINYLTTEEVDEIYHEIKKEVENNKTLTNKQRKTYKLYINLIEDCKYFKNTKKQKNIIR